MHWIGRLSVSFHSFLVVFSSVAVFRLQAQHKQLCQKLQNEEELEGQIRAEVRQQEWVQHDDGLFVPARFDRH